jgi:hypothetical protein
MAIRRAFASCGPGLVTLAMSVGVASVAVAPVSAQVRRSARVANATPQIPDGRTSATATVRRPRTIVYSADGSAFLAGDGKSARSPGNLKWSSWSSSKAVATGADWHDNCAPSCAKGTYKAYRGTVVLSHPTKLGGRLVFTRMTVTYSGAHPPYLAYKSGVWLAHLRYSTKFGPAYFWN